MATETLRILDIHVTCANGTGETFHYIDIVDPARARFFRQRESFDPTAVADMISAVAETYTLRLSLHRDFTLSLALPTRIPHLPNGGLPNAYISQIRSFEICEPFLLLAQPRRTARHALMRTEPRWGKVLRRLTVRSQYFPSAPTSPSGWRIVARRWERYVGYVGTPPDFPAIDALASASAFVTRMSPHLNAAIHAWNARIEEDEEILTPEMLFSLQQAVATAQLFEGDVARVHNGSEGGKWQVLGREVAARCYRTACLDGEAVGWEGC